MLILGGGKDGERGSGNDRVDALVWGLSELMLGPPLEGPRIRVL